MAVHEEGKQEEGEHHQDLALGWEDQAEVLSEASLPQLHVR
jgi:hypothetical protein